DRLHEYLAEQEPLVTVDTALSMKNDSDEANEQIVSALRQPPKSDSEVNWEASVNRHAYMDMKSSNPILGSSVTEFEVSGLTTPSLFAFDWQFIPFGNADLIESWDTSEDRMYDKVVLRNDATWSDGKPITAHDVAFTFQAIMNPKVPAVAVRSGTDQLRWVHAYDDRTVVFFHKEALATNVWNMFYPIIPAHIYSESIEDDPSLSESEYHLKHERTPISGGPYVITRRVRNQEIVLERREDWYMHDGQQIRKKPYLKEIRFRILEDPNTALLALKNGEIDELELRAQAWTTQTSDDDFYRVNTKASGTEWAFAYIGWNTETVFFSDARVRKAMSYTLNHDEMINNICYGLYEPGQGIYHPTAWMAPDPMPEPYQQNLDKAEALLDEAGWDDSDGDGIRDKEIGGRKVNFEFTILIASSSETGLKICELLRESLDRIGIICNIKPTEFTVLQENARTHKFQAMMAGWGTGTDPDTGENLWTTKALKQNGRNYVQYTNPRVDELFEQGKREFDRDKRAEIYGQIHTQLWEDQPYTWLYYRSSFFGFNKRLRGYMFSPRGPFGYAPGFGSVWVAAE
ncbi:MAG: peptide-binding protein, partial [Maioricimonas sp. JB049]